MTATAVASRAVVPAGANRAVRLGVVGPLEVRIDGRALEAKDVGSRKARTLLALLAVERPRPVPVDLIVEAVWGDAPSRRPLQDVATLVSRLRTTLGRDAVSGGRNAYRLGDGVRVDLADAQSLVTDAERRTPAEPGAALDVARRAVRLLDRGGVLMDLPLAEWAEPARAVHALLLRRARHAAAAAALRAGEPGVAQDLSEAALRADPYDEASCRLAMRAHHAAGEPARALSAFARLRTTLADDLGVDPSPETRQLHVAILRGNRPTPSTVDIRTTSTAAPFASFIPTWTPPPPLHRDREVPPWLVAVSATRAGHDGRRDAAPAPPPAPELDPGSHRVRAAVDRLPARERDVLRLHHFDRLSHAQIAVRLGIPVGTVKSRSHRGHRRLTTWLAGIGTISP
jgi:DNA-binding SARP family transcriptional activator